MGADPGKQQRAAEKKARMAAKEAIRQQQKQAKALERQMSLQRQAMLEQTESMRASKAPEATGATLGSEEQGIKTARSRRKTAKTLGKGLSALRIPLNLG